MQMAEQFDISTLAWVKGEIDETLKQARIALEAYVDDRGNKDALRHCLELVHQVQGTLQVVELSGAALFAAEMERLAQGLLDQLLAAAEDALELLMRAILQLPDYLESLLDGKGDNPIVLLPLLNEMRQLRGDERLDDAQFFHPNLQIDPPPRAAGAELAVDGQAAAGKLHRFYLASLAKLFKHPEQASEQLQLLAQLLDRLYPSAATPVWRRILWVAQAFLEALQQQFVVLDKDSKLLLGKLEQQIKATAQGGEPAELDEARSHLLRQMLYLLARGQATGKRAATIRLAFDLDRLMPGHGVALGGMNAELKQTVAADVLEELTRIKDVFDIFVRGDRRDRDSLAPMAERLEAMADTLALLQEESLQQSLHQQNQVVQSLINGEAPADDDTLMGIAGAIIAVESALGDWGANAPLVVADAREEQLADNESTPQAEAEHQRVTRQVMREAKEDLIRVREAISQYLGTTQDKALLASLPQLLHMVIGSLSLLSYRRVAQVLISCRAFVEEVLQGRDELPDAETLDALADALMSVEYYLEAFIHSRVHPGSVLDVAEQAVARLGYPIGLLPGPGDEPSSEEQPELAGIEVEDDWSTLSAAQPVESTVAADEPEPAIETEARLTPPAAVEATDETAVDETLDALPSPDREVPEPARIGPADSEVDEEILEIFIEEAEEELQQIRRLLPDWIADPSDADTLKTMRRSFHTLKGSGRLVGASEIGEFAWAFENMLNRIIDGTLQTNAAIFDMLEQARDVLPALIDGFRQGAPGNEDAELLREMAQAITQPGGLDALASAPAPAVISQPAEQPAPSAIPDLEPVLLDIYHQETASHLQQVDDYIAAYRDGGSHLVTEPLIRALHTLKGSSRMAAIEPVAQLCEVLEKYAKALQSTHQSVSSDGLLALETARDFLRGVLAYLRDRQLPEPDNRQALEQARQVYGEVAHLEGAVPLMPEAGLASVAEEPEPATAPTTAEQPVEELEPMEPEPTEPEPTEVAGEALLEPVSTEETAWSASLLEEDSAAAEESDQGAGDAWLEQALEDEHWLAQSLEEEEPQPVDEPEVVSGEQVELTQAAVDSEADYDEELLEIFLEEAAEILDASEETLHQWVNHPQDKELIEALQRQLHTLKGGARMAGVAAIGDLSHCLESTLEAAYEGRLDPTTAMLDLLQLSHDRLVVMLDQVRSRSPLSDGTDLIEQMNTLGQGEQAPGDLPELATPPSTTGSPVSDALELIEPTISTAQEAVEAEVDAREVAPLAAALDELEFQLSQWQRDPDDQQVFEQAISAAKGLSLAAGGLDTPALSDLSSALLRLLGALRDGHIPVSAKSTDMLAMAMDRLRHQLGQLREQQPLEHAGFLVADIDEAIAQGLAEQGAIMLPARGSVEVPATTDSAPADKPPAAEGDDKRRGSRMQHEMVRVRADILDALVNYAGEVSIYRSRVEQQIASFRGSIQELDQTIARLREQVRQFDIENEAQIESRREEAQKAGYEDFDPLEFDRFTHMQQLSRSMMESLSDMLSIEDMLTNLTRESETLLLQQARVNTDLQESLLHTRMIPLVDNAPRLRRVVRQTASELGKRAALNFDGVEVEMDRNVVERLMAPLEHMLRNSIAHGIEQPEQRTRAGKSEEGQIRIALSREGSEIVVQVADDGAGINLQAVRDKAIARGLVPQDAQLSDREWAQFILQSGFSTADSVSQIAGRGVGMDVVASEIKQLGGVLDIDSRPGHGTTFTIRLPLTLSVSRALLVQVADDTYAIPLMGIRTIERISGQELETRLQADEAVYSWLGDEYRLMHLTQVLGLGQGVIHSESGKQALLLAASGEQRIALAIDGLLGSREVVVKSMGPLLSQINDLAGATILADGSIAPILDMPALIRRGLARSAEQTPTAIQEMGAEREPLVMVVDDSITVRKVTERLLRRHNMRCVTAKDGVEALTMLEEHLPDVMLLDIEMPRMDGFELATHMRNSERYRAVPIIMITSRTGDKHRQRAMEIGVNRYMGKPYTEVDLLDNIQQLIHPEETQV